jgi:cell wall-associated NlpC family hydrolase
MPSGLIAGGLAALSLAGSAFVVVLGPGTAGPTATPSFNVDALPAAAQDYVPYLEQGGLACADVSAALLAAQVQVSDPSWDPDLTTTYKYKYTYTVGGAGPATTTTVAPPSAPPPTTAPPPPPRGTATTTKKTAKTTTVTVTVKVTYEGLLQKTASWWAANGIDGDSVGPALGSGDPYDAEDAIATLARLDCNLASELNVDALSQSSGLAVDDLIVAAYYGGAGSTTSYAHATGALPPDTQAQAVLAALATFSLDGTDGSGGAAPAATTTTVPAGSTPGPLPPSSDLGAAIVAFAQDELGVPYVWGGGDYAGPTNGLAGGSVVGFDCSGLALYAVYQASGGAVALPHYTGTQVQMGQQVFVGSGAEALASGLVQPGDLIYFDNVDPTQAGWDHVGIYVGGGDTIDAPQTGEDVQVDNLATTDWEGVQWDVRRFS